MFLVSVFMDFRCFDKKLDANRGRWYTFSDLLLLIQLFMKEKIFNNLVDGIEVRVCFSDICVMNAEACVVPQFSNRVADTGVAATLLHSGFSRGVLEYGELFERYKAKALPFGSAFTTNAYTGGYAWFIHVPVLDAESFEVYDAAMFAVYAALYEADRLNLYDIVIPALCTGHKGLLSFKQSAKAMLTALKSFRSEHDTLREIKFVISKNEAAYQEFVSFVENNFDEVPVISGLEESYLQITEVYR